MRRRVGHCLLGSVSSGLMRAEVVNLLGTHEAERRREICLVAGLYELGLEQTPRAAKGFGFENLIVTVLSGYFVCSRT